MGSVSTENQEEQRPHPSLTEPKVRVKLLLPLYIYPLSETTWQPLYEAISSHPNVDFVVVVNPRSGPTDDPLPQPDYLRELPKLNAYSNVQTIGYVRIDYCRKPWEEVCAEIDRYAAWSFNPENPGLGIEGIFLDETPNHHKTHRADFLESLNAYIKASKGIGGNRLIIHNPGTPPDTGLADPGPDVIITCEEPYDKYMGWQVQQRLEAYHYSQRRSGYMISGVPQDEIAGVTRALTLRGSYLFVTDVVDDFYEHFGQTWRDFVDAIDAQVLPCEA